MKRLFTSVIRHRFLTAILAAVAFLTLGAFAKGGTKAAPIDRPQGQKDKTVQSSEDKAAQGPEDQQEEQ